MLIALVGAGSVAAPVQAAPRIPRVALIVGPAGSVTDAYRRLANEAGAAAAAAGAEIVKVYSPNATWPAVKRATRGASIVVYLGHGNGWPSKYRNSLYPPTQNGFGLNPVAGGDDSTHQYFGEASIERLALAPNAVVVFSHLCYASGNTEPGLPEGTRDQAIQRVDNYAAGFIRAGAKAVIADAALGPAYYVRALLRGRGTVESIWNDAPTANGRHSIAARSVRSPGFGLRLDPRRADGGYTRSLVSRGLTAAQVRASGQGTAAGAGRDGTVAVPVVPSLARAGLKFAEPVLRSLPVAGTTTRVTLPLASGRSTGIPAGARLAVRWDLLQPDAPAAPEPAVAPAPAVESPAPLASFEPSAEPTLPPLAAPLASPTVDPDAVARFLNPNASVTPDAAPSAAPAPAASPDPTLVAPEVDLVVPEQVGAIVEPVKAIRNPRGISLDVSYPRVPGLYRLSATLHTAEGVAYDEATQALLTPVIVHIGGPTAVAYGVPATLSLTAGEPADVAVAVLNAGSVRWNAVVAPIDAPTTSVTTTGSPEATSPSPDAPAAATSPSPAAASPAPDASGSAAPDATSSTLPGPTASPDTASPAPAAAATPEPADPARLPGSTGTQPDASAESAPADPVPGSAFVLPQLVATWVSADGGPVPDPLVSTLPGEAWAPGGSATVVLGLVAPDVPGSYLLLLDVLTPEHGAMSALGSAPALIRVTVNGVAPASTPAPAGGAPGITTVPDVTTEPAASPLASASASPAAAPDGPSPVVIELPPAFGS